MKTTAEVNYRTYVPHDWIAFEFCTVEFYGENAQELEDKWDKVEDTLYTEHKSEVKKIKEKINKLSKQIDELTDEYNSFRKWYRPWKTKEQKVLCLKIEKLNDDRYNVEEELEDLGSHPSYSDFQIEAKYFLIENGFVKIQHNKSECNTHHEIWEKVK